MLPRRTIRQAKLLPTPFFVTRLRLAREACVARNAGWRVNDVVANDVMRESATMLTALLLRASNDDSARSAALDSEVRQLRHSMLSVDSFDRAAVASLTDRIRVRIRELTESKP